MSDDVIYGGQDYIVPFSIPKADGAMSKDTDFVDMYADVYGVSGTKYASYSLKSQPTGVKKISFDGTDTFSIWIDSATTKLAIGDTLRCMINAVTQVPVELIADQRCNTPYTLDLPSVVEPPVEIKA